LAIRVEIYKRKFDFRSQETLPKPDYATADGQKIYYKGYKKLQRRQNLATGRQKSKKIGQLFSKKLIPDLIIAL
jgi:hypothetical protein